MLTWSLDLIKHTLVKIILKNYGINKWRSQSHHEQGICYICKKEFSTDDKEYKIRDHFHYTGKYRSTAHNICNLKYKTPKEILVIFHNGSNYDYHFIIKDLAKKIKGQFECSEGNIEKYITFSVPINKELKNGKTLA